MLKHLLAQNAMQRKYNLKQKILQRLISLKFPPVHYINNKANWQAERLCLDTKCCLIYRAQIKLFELFHQHPKIQLWPAVVSCWAPVTWGKRPPLGFYERTLHEGLHSDHPIVFTSSKCPVCFLRVGITLTNLRRASWRWSRRPWTSLSNR